MIQESGPKDWSTYTWYQVGTDLGAGASAMIFDADILGYFMNGGDNKMAGKLAYRRLQGQSGRQGADPEHLDLVAVDVQLLQGQGRHLVLHAVGLRTRACAVRRHQDGLRQSGPPVGLEGRGVPREAEQELSGLCRDVRRFGTGRQHQVHARSRCSSTSPPNGRRRCRRWWPRKCRSTKASTSWPRASIGQLKEAGLG